jgi:hypothetical protein
MKRCLSLSISARPSFRFSSAFASGLEDTRLSRSSFIWRCSEVVEALEELKRSLPEESATAVQQPMELEKRPKRVAKRRFKPAQQQTEAQPEEAAATSTVVDNKPCTPVRRVAKRRQVAPPTPTPSCAAGGQQKEANDDKENVKPLVRRLSQLYIHQQ